MRIFWENFVDSATLTGSSINQNFPVSNLQDYVLKKKFRTTGVTSENVVFDRASTVATSVIIIGHNLTSSATITFQGNNTDVWTSPSFSQVLTYNSGMIIGEFSEITYNYYRILIADATNTDGYIELSRVFIGGVLEMPAMARSQGLPTGTTGKQSISPNRILFGRRGSIYRDAKISTPFFDFDKKAEIDEAFEAVQNYKPVILQIWPEQLTDQPSIYCVLDGDTIPHKGNDNGSNKWQSVFSFKQIF